MDKDLLHYLLESDESIGRVLSSGFKAVYLDIANNGFSDIRGLFNLSIEFYLKFRKRLDSEHLQAYLEHKRLSIDEKKAILVLFEEIKMWAPSKDMEFLLDAIKSRYARGLLQKHLDIGTDHLINNNVPAALNKIKEAIYSAENVLNETSVSGELRDSVLLRSRAYGDLKRGITKVGIEMGFPTIDTLTGGMKDGELITMMAGTAEGKCFEKDTKILMSDGSIKLVQDIYINNTVMGPDSKARKVKETHSGVGELYKIVPHRGEPFVVNGEHILTLYNWHHSKRKFFNISVSDYLQSNKTLKRCSMIYRSAVDFKKRSVVIDPYYLGAWLGDGTARTHEITTADTEIVSFLKGYAKKLGYTCKRHDWNNSHGKAHVYGIVKSKGRKNILLEGLKKLNLYRNKHIPDIYLRNDASTRLQVLAGLIDTDGHLNIHNNYQITTKLEKLKDDILYLSRSLGFGATWSSVKKYCTVNNKRVTGNYYLITITGHIDKIPCKIARKKARKRTARHDAKQTGFKIEPIGRGEYYGFEIDKDHLFLLGDFTVVHNSVFLLNVGHYVHKMLHKNVMHVSLENAKHQVERRYDSCHSGLSYTKLRSGTLNPEEEDIYKKALKEQQVNPAVLYIWDQPVCSPNQIAAKITELASKYTFDLIIIDYISLLTSDRPRKERGWQELSDITLDLRAIARSFKVPIITAAQVGRKGMQSKKTYYDHTDIGFAHAIIHNSDTVVSFRVSNPDILKTGLGICDLNASMEKCRDGASGTFVMDANFDRMKMQERVIG